MPEIGKMECGTRPKLQAAAYSIIMSMGSPDNISLSRRNIQRVYGTSFSDGNFVTLVWRDKESFQAIFDSIKNAKELICLQFYIFRNDETGNELAEILLQKAAEGVRIYILYDHFGSFTTPLRFWRRLRDAGIRINSSRPFRWKYPFRYIHRDHRKLIIIDGTRAFTGGINIANEYRGYHLFHKKKGWRDTGIFLEGPVAKTLMETFKAAWEIRKGEPILFDREVPRKETGVPVLPIFASSAKGRRRMRKLLYYSINLSKRSIYLTTAYFTPSRRMLQILENAVSRGVDVKLLLPGRSDISAARYAGRAFFTKLLKVGVDIYTYNGEILHAKTAVFDEEWSIIGSANLDFQSLRRNDEGNVGIINKKFGSQMAAMFREDMNNSERITREIWKKRPFCEKVKEHFFALFRRRL